MTLYLYKSYVHIKVLKKKWRNTECHLLLKNLFQYIQVTVSYWINYFRYELIISYKNVQIIINQHNIWYGWIDTVTPESQNCLRNYYSLYKLNNK